MKLTGGKQERDFIFIGDAADAYVGVVQSAGRPQWQEYEVGSGHALSVRKWVERVHALTGSAASLLFGALPYRDGEIMSSRADTTALERLSWHALTSLDDGLRQTIEWEKSQIATAASKTRAAP